MQHLLQHAAVLREGWTKRPSAAAVTGGWRNNLPCQTFNLIQSQKPFGACVFPQLLTESFEACREAR